jgi:hypothetical protein
MVPWYGGYCLTWGTKIVATLAASYLAANTSAGGGACQLPSPDNLLYFSHFAPIAVE